MTILEEILLWLTVGVYALNPLLFILHLIKKKQVYALISTYVLLFGALLQIGALGYRTYLSGHLPGNDLYELNALGALFIVLTFLVVQNRNSSLRLMGPLAALAGIILLVGGFLSNPEISPLPPLYRSEWFFFHISSAFLSFGAYTIGAGISFIYLLREYKPEFNLIGNQSLSDLDGLVFRLISFGFVFHALMVITGALWASTAWGSYWSWDPLETWSLVTWLIYGTYIHLYVTLGWRGKRMAWFNILAVGLIVFTFWGLGHLPGTIGGKK